jgi:predicted enzyme related to lactoylglutathione lyase
MINPTLSEIALPCPVEVAFDGLLRNDADAFWDMCPIRAKARACAHGEGSFEMAVHYLEIVSDDVDALTALYQGTHGLSFGPPDPDLGQARVATQTDGTLVGIRKPLATHEQPIMRAYFAVEDIQQAVKKAQESGATIAYPPTCQGNRGTFAIMIQGDLEHGLWQR